MKRKFVYLALAALAFGIITSPKTTAEPKNHPQHDVVFLHGVQGYPYVYISHSSSNAPIVPTVNDILATNGLTMPNAVAQLLDDDFVQAYATTSDFGLFTLQFIRRR